MAEILYRYYSKNRPPDCGCPSGAVRVESFGRCTLVARAEDKDGPVLEQEAWGWVDYNQPLSLFEMWRYELRPLVTEHFNTYFALMRYESSDQDELHAISMANNYLDMAEMDLESVEARTNRLIRIIRWAKSVGLLDREKLIARLEQERRGNRE